MKAEPTTLLPSASAFCLLDGIGPRVAWLAHRVATNNPLKVWLAWAILLGIAAPVAATVARSISFDEKVQQADGIFLGRCTAIRSAWDPTGRWILTYSTFQVEKAFKGPAVPEVTLVTPGGQVGSIRQETVGVPDFTAGQQNVVFLKRGSVGPTVLYLDQGVYDVAPDDRGELEVKPVASNLVLVDSQTGKVPGAETARSLRGFEQEVRAAMDRTERAQRYGVAPRAEAEESAFSPLTQFLRRHWLVVSLLLLAIAGSTYLLTKSR